MSNRILDYPEATEITSNDYILLDNEGTGAKCIKASALNINMDNYTIKEARGAIASFDDGEDLPLAFMGAYITAIQEGSGDPSPENIRPIIGWDECNVTRCGKNRFKLDAVTSFIKNGVVSTQGLTNQDGVITNSKSYGGDGRFPYYYPMTFSSNTITVSADIKLSGNHSNNIVFIEMFNSNGSEIIADGEVTMSSKDAWEHKAITLQLSSLTNVNLLIEAKGANNSVQIKNVQVENGSTATTYTPYNGNTYTLTFTDGTNPLTVYGGYVDLVSGVLTVDRVKLTNDYLVNTASYESAGRGCFALIGITLKSMGSDVVDTKLMASALKTSSQNDLYTNKNIGIAHWWNTMIGFSTGDATITTASALKQWLALNGSDVVYELATPLTYQLSKQQIKSLVGENNIFADTGDSVVDYRKLWVMPEM